MSTTAQARPNPDRHSSTPIICDIYVRLFPGHLDEFASRLDRLIQQTKHNREHDRGRGRSL